MAGKYAAVTPGTLFADDATKAMQFACPIVDEIRGVLIAKDGVFVTAVKDAAGDVVGGVLGYAKFGWSLFDRKALTKAIARATDVEAVGLPGPWVNRTPTVIEGFVVQLTTADAELFGVDMVQMPNSGLIGCIALTANAMVYALTGKEARNANASDRERATNDVTAIPLAEGLAALRAGHVVNVPARAATATQQALPALRLPAFPAGKVVSAGTAAPAKPAFSAYSGLSSAQVIEETAAEQPIRNQYAARSNSGNFGRRS